jgi:hypothetical protein
MRKVLTIGVNPGLLLSGSLVQGPGGLLTARFLSGQKNRNLYFLTVNMVFLKLDPAIDAKHRLDELWVFDRYSYSSDPFIFSK